MSMPAPKPATTPIPVQLSANEFDALAHVGFQGRGWVLSQIFVCRHFGGSSAGWERDDAARDDGVGHGEALSNSVIPGALTPQGQQCHTGEGRRRRRLGPGLRQEHGHGRPGLLHGARARTTGLCPC